MNQIAIKSTCPSCQGQGLLSTGKIYVLGGREHPLLTRCQACEGKGTVLAWLDVHQFAQMLHAIAVEEQAQ